MRESAPLRNRLRHGNGRVFQRNQARERRPACFGAIKAEIEDLGGLFCGDLKLRASNGDYLGRFAMGWNS
jgi:hypothetical protein